jgi:protein-tyrosine phosphatase
MVDLILAGELKEADDAFMTEVYISMVTEGAPAFGRLLTHLTDDDGLPALFHCAAGKDRTGLAAAFLLSVLGVADEVILDDYELSTKFRSEKRIEMLRPQLEAAGVDIEKVRPFLSARRPVMEETLQFVNSEYGGVEPYLRDRAHMSATTIQTLRDRLLEP